MTGDAVKLCDLDSLEPGDIKAIDVDGRAVLCARIEDAWYAIDDTCSHAEVSLADGILEEEDLAVECPRHGALFSLETGEALTLPAIKAVASHPIDVRDDGVYVTIRADIQSATTSQEEQ